MLGKENPNLPAPTHVASVRSTPNNTVLLRQNKRHVKGKRWEECFGGNENRRLSLHLVRSPNTRCNERGIHTWRSHRNWSVALTRNPFVRAASQKGKRRRRLDWWHFIPGNVSSSPSAPSTRIRGANSCNCVRASPVNIL